jgi:hypothetical protein
MMVLRRFFLQLAGAAALSPLSSFFDCVQEQFKVPPLVDQVPPMLDHILLGCNHLQRGIDFVEQHTGVRAAFGGVHPNRGTHNALLALGTLRYLEIIAPDPQQQTDNSLAKRLQAMPEPKLATWAVHTADISALTAKLKSVGIAAEGPIPGSRKPPDGQELHWQTLGLKDDANGLLPFFIEWSKSSVHPSEAAPKGCQLLKFEILTPQSATLAKLCSPIGLEVQISPGPVAQLRASIIGPKGKLELTS